MVQYGFFYDQSRCITCRTCMLSCWDWNAKGPGPERWRRVYEWEKGAFPKVLSHRLSFACGHCENPVCIDACQKAGMNAIYKEDKYGAVLIDQEKCNGCRQCWVACPYGAPQFASDDPTEKAYMCTMCIDRLEQGKKPRCVSSCYMRALDFGPLEDMIKQYGTLRQLEDMPDPTLTETRQHLQANGQEG